MPLLQVISTAPRAGKTTVAAGLAQGLAREGRHVDLLRVGASEAAADDARTFASYLFASAPAEPVPREPLKAAPDRVVVVEIDAGDEPLDAPAVVVVRGGPSAEDAGLGKRLGGRLIGSIATVVPFTAIEDVARALTNADLRPLAVLPEDACLAAPSVEDIRHALAADVLHEGENFQVAIENLLVAPVYTDGAKVHFRRYRGTAAVLAPSYKTDLLLAAIEAEASCVIVTGGHQPSHYVMDRVEREPVTLLLAQHQTPAAVSALSDVWTASAFAGEAKAEAVFALLESRIDWAALIKKLA